MGSLVLWFFKFNKLYEHSQGRLNYILDKVRTIGSHFRYWQFGLRWNHTRFKRPKVEGSVGVDESWIKQLEFVANLRKNRANPHKDSLVVRLRIKENSWSIF